MRSNLNRFILLCLFSLAAALPATDAAAAFSADAAVESTEVFVGESFVYQIQVQGEDAPEQPDLSRLSDFSVAFVGGQQNNSSSITIINGKTTRDVRRGYIFNYRLTPKRAGTLTIPSVTITAGKQTARTRPIQIRADKPREIDDFHFELSLSPDTCYVGQPVTLKAIWYIGGDVQQFLFNLPILDDPRFTVADWDLPVDPNRKERYLQVPLGTGQTIGIKEQRTLNGRPWTTVRFEKVLIPGSPGTFEIDESTVSFVAVTGHRRPSSRSMFDDFFGNRAVTEKFVIPSNTPTLTVRPLPVAGRPADFTGLVGQYKIEAEASPTTVKVGDPITLTVRVSGPDYLDPVTLPALDQQPALARDFRIPSEMAPGVIKGDAKIFTQTLRATHDGVEAIAPISLSYFDAEAGEYRIARSEPVPLQVSATRIVTAQDAEGIETQGVAKSELETWAEGIAYNYEDLSVLRSQSAGLSHWKSSPYWIALLAGFPLLYGITFSITAFRRSRNADPKNNRRRKAYAKLKKNLKQLDISTPDADSQTGAGVLSAMREYLAAKLDLPPGGTWPEFESALQQRDTDEKTVAELKALFVTCEAIEYGGIAALDDTGTPLGDRAAALAKRLERSLS